MTHLDLGGDLVGLCHVLRDDALLHLCLGLVVLHLDQQLRRLPEKEREGGGRERESGTVS